MAVQLRVLSNITLLASTTISMRPSASVCHVVTLQLINSRSLAMILEGCTASGGLDAAKSTKASPQVDDLATCGLYCQGNTHMGFELGSSCACSNKRPTVTDCSSGGVDKIYQVQGKSQNHFIDFE